MEANDTILIAVLAIFFIATGILVSAVQIELGESSQEYNTEEITNNVKEELNKDNVTNIFNVLLNIAKMASFSFGTLPLLVDLFLLIPRIMFWYTIAKNLRGVGS